MDLFDPVIHARKPWDEERLMKSIKLRKIAGILADEDSGENTGQELFCTKISLPSADIQISVEGIGKLVLPLPKCTIEKLKEISTKAKFGLGEKTVMDDNFRDTHMIESSKLAVNFSEESLSLILKRMQPSLGLPVESKLEAHIHNLLIYGPGQFFKRHRDSEKVPKMIATLVIVLPSPHIGGSLIVEHGKKNIVVETENLDETRATCVLFYSDCWHEVKPIKAGHRIVLTYNIAIEGSEFPLKPPDRELENAIRSYFADDNEKEEICLKLVFLLNHSYSKQSLKWSLLKGEDQEVASKLLMVAKSLNLTIHLALVDIHQNWICGDDDEHDSSNMELFNSEHELVFWVDENDVVLPYGKFEPERSEICFTKETFHENFEPSSEEINGPTGNEGCTSDYWYQRAAIVMWNAKKSDIVKFELDFDGSVKSLVDLLGTPGSEGEVLRYVNLVRKISQDMKKSCENMFRDFVDIALYIKNDAAAEKLLSIYTGRQVTVENIEKIVALQNQYGTEFCRKLFRTWLDSRGITSLMPFAEEYLKAGGDIGILEFMIGLELECRTRSVNRNRDYHYSFIKACDVIGNVVYQEKYVNSLLSSNSMSNIDMGNLLRDLLKTVSEDSGRFEPFRLSLIDAVRADIEGRNLQGFWHVKESSYCSCDACKALNVFLRSNEESLLLPGNKTRHIKSKIMYSPVLDFSVSGKGKKTATTVKKNKSVYENAEGKLNELSKIIQEFERPARLKRQATVDSETLVLKKNKSSQ